MAADGLRWAQDEDEARARASLLQGGCTALHRAAQNGHATAVEQLLKGGANVNAEDKVCAHTKVPRLLWWVPVLKASVREPWSQKGYVVLHLAAEANSEEVVEQLLKANASVDAKDQVCARASVFPLCGCCLLAKGAGVRGARFCLRCRMARQRCTLRLRPAACKWWRVCSAAMPTWTRCAATRLSSRGDCVALAGKTRHRCTWLV